MPPAPDAMSVDDSVWDVLVIGAGVNGAATAKALSEDGYRVLVVDRGDIGGGTSQASTMLIWGGLLYLKDWELRTVWELCRERDRLIADAPAQVRRCQVRYVPTAGARPRAALLAALHAYWALGGGRRRPARRLGAYAERALLTPAHGDAFAFEEATLPGSDARFVLEVLGNAESRGAHVRTYHRVDGCAFDETRRRWTVTLTDTRTGRESNADARLVINAAGPWADGVNARAGVETPYRHILSRGVSITFARDPQHEAHLVFDTDDGNALTLAPWGPVALWASTESLHDSVDEAACTTPEDVTYLIDQYNARFRAAKGADDVVALRVGVRPVPVRRGQAVDARGLGLSRHHRLHVDAARPWLTIFGGKLSGCHGLAREIRARVQSRPLAIAPDATHRTSPSDLGRVRDTPAVETFPGMPVPVVAPDWSARHEHCRTLADYVRRRTNIAQWIPNGGFGRHDEHAEALRRVAVAVHHGDEAAAARDLDYWRAHVADDRRVLAATARLLGAPSVGVSA